MGFIFALLALLVFLVTLVGIQTDFDPIDILAVGGVLVSLAVLVGAAIPNWPWNRP